MAQLLTFLGPDRSACAVASVAMARRLGQSGQRVLWVTQGGSALGQTLWGQPLGETPGTVAPGVEAIDAKTAGMLAQNWEMVKTLEAQYLRDPLLKQVYREELTVLPGMDEALALNALREWDASGDYDAVVFEGRDGLSTLRMWAMPDSLDWYLRRFQAVVEASDLARALSPFIQPLAGVILASGGGVDRLQQPFGQGRGFLAAGRQAVQDPQRVLGFLVTGEQPGAIALSQYLWGSSQLVGLTVAGVLTVGNPQGTTPLPFDPLPIHRLPDPQGQDWSGVTAALPDLAAAIAIAPRAITIDEAAATVRLFLPGFDKSQITLTQSGPEVTIEAGDQRRNLLLPESLRRRPVRGAKFQDNALILSFAP